MWVLLAKCWIVLCHSRLSVGEPLTCGTSMEACSASQHTQHLIDALARDPDPHSRKVEASELAVKMKNDGRHAEAIPHLRVATFYQPWLASIWFHLGEALFKAGTRNNKRTDDANKPDVGKLICESVAAFELSSYLFNLPLTPLGPQKEKYGDIGLGFRAPDPQVNLMIRRAFGMAKQRFPGHCMFPGSCNKYWVHRQAMALESVGKHIEAANLICDDASSVRVMLEEEDQQRGVPSAFYARAVFILMRVCGVVALPALYPPQRLAPVVEAQRSFFEEWLASNSIFNESVFVESEHVASRADRRYELLLPMQAPFTDEGFADNKYLLWVSKLLMSNRFLIDTFSFVVSLPGAPDGEWHNDVSPLFADFENALTEHLPPMGLVAIIPFVNMSSTSGPTEHKFGSHFLFSGNDIPTASAKIEAGVGDVVLFDIRLSHRGTANQGINPRSIAYISYTHRWFTDVVNFKSLQSQQWDKLGSSSRQQLFHRVDNRQYAHNLQEQFVKPEMRSATAYKANQLKIL